jgi:hypothetical protein
VSFASFATHVVVEVYPARADSVLDFLERLPALPAEHLEPAAVLGAEVAASNHALAARHVAEDLDERLLAVADRDQEVGEAVDVKVAWADWERNIALSWDGHHELEVGEELVDRNGGIVLPSVPTQRRLTGLFSQNLNSKNGSALQSSS